MEKRQLGKTGVFLSVLGYGASPLGGEFGQIDEDEGIQAVRLALSVRTTT
jgi:L-galactose dehydrogenase